MITILSDWAIIKVMNREQYIASTLWGIVVEDQTCRFKEGDYVCSSIIKSIIPNQRKIITKSGNNYFVLGSGYKFTATIDELEKLRAGLSPFELTTINLLKKMEC